MRIVFLDSGVINPGDISWDGIEALGTFENYRMTVREDICQRLKGADAVLIDSVVLDREILQGCPDLRYIGIAATGFNHVELEAASAQEIAVTNVPAYASEAVAQHAIALLLSVTNQVETYHRAVADGQWRKQGAGIYGIAPMTLLSGKSIGIVGYGGIGRKIAQLAEALGMKVNVYSSEPEAAIASDVVSLSCPLTKENAGMVDAAFLSRMKDGAILINTARGGLVDEEALAAALQSGKLAGAGLDVLAKEPPEDDNLLLRLENCVITPHIGFYPIETRRSVIETCAANLRSFQEGGRLNRLV